eukprot:gene113-biopygen11573
MVGSVGRPLPRALRLQQRAHHGLEVPRVLVPTPPAHSVPDEWSRPATEAPGDGGMRTDARASVDLAWAQPKRDRDHHRGLVPLLESLAAVCGGDVGRGEKGVAVRSTAERLSDIATLPPRKQQRSDQPSRGH